jgi:hypothetical protein
MWRDSDGSVNHDRRALCAQRTLAGRRPAANPSTSRTCVVWDPDSTVKMLMSVVTSFVTTIVVFMTPSKKLHRTRCRQHEDDAGDENGSVGQPVH